MSPIALADARTTNRGCCFCLAVIFFLFVPILRAEQLFNSTQDFTDSSQISRFHPLLLVAAFSPAIQGQSYASTVHVQSGIAPYRFWISGGALPSGLSLNSSTGTISGVPAVSGTFVFSVAATDSQFGYGRQVLQLNVGSNPQGQISIALSPETAQIAPGAKVQFAATVKNTSQTAVVWSASAGSISPNGLFTAPPRAGSAVVTASAAASSGVRASATILVQTSAPLTIATSSLMNAQVNSSYSTAMIAQGGSGPYVWSLYSGALPSGLTLDPTNGVIAGRIGQAGVYTFTAKVTDSLAHSSTRQLTLNVTAISSSNFDGPAELPRVYVQSALSNTPAPGNMIKVNAGSSFQSALDNASCGDTVELQAGATFSGHFTLPSKNCDDNHWIIIRTSAPDSSLPAEGTRISPCYAGVASLPDRPALNCASSQKVMATLMAEKFGGPIALASGANHYRIGPGLEITRPVGTGVNYGLIIKDAHQPADHIIVDRDWVHGTARDETVRGVFMSGLNYAAVTDSYFSDFHCTAGIGACVDSQTIAGGTGPLPQGAWRIHNNFLEAAAENILFGGTKSNSVTPADIEITQNHFFKPLSWMPRSAQPNFVGGQDSTPSRCANFDPNGGGQCPFIVKNLFELKNAQRVLFQGNVLENVWAGFTQHGQSILIEGANSSVNPIYSKVSVTDVTIRYNRISHSHSGFGITDPGINGVPNLPIGNISVHDDIFDDISAAYENGDTTGAWALEQTYCGTCTPSHDIAINHITEIITQAKNVFLVEGGLTSNPIRNWTYTNSIVTVSAGLAISGAGIANPCGFSGATNLARIISCAGPSYTMARNALVGATGTWPQGNFLPPSASAVGFVDYNNGVGGDYHLSLTSPYKNAASDRTDLGANVDAVARATNGVL